MYHQTALQQTLSFLWVVSVSEDLMFCLVKANDIRSEYTTSFISLTCSPGVDREGRPHRQLVVRRPGDWLLLLLNAYK